MIYILFIGFVGSFAIGAFSRITVMRFLIIGVILYLAFGAAGILPFVAGSMISLYDDWLINHPNLKIGSIAFNRVPIWLVMGAFITTMVLAIIVIAYNLVKQLT